MKKLQVFCVVAAIVATICIGNVHAKPEVSEITDDDYDWGAFDRLKNLVELKYGDPNNVEGHWEMGLRKKHHGFDPKKKHEDYSWINWLDEKTWPKNGHEHKDMNLFSLEFIQATGEVIFTLGWPNHKQRQMTYQYDEYAGRGMDELHILARKGNPDKHDCSIEFLEMDGKYILDNLVGTKKNAYIEVTEIGCGGFTLTGYVKLGWNEKPKKNADIEALFAFGPPCDAQFWVKEGNITVANAGPQSDPWTAKFISKESESPRSASLICDLPAKITFDSMDLLSADYALAEGVFQGASPRFSLMLDMNDDDQIDPNDQPVSVHWVIPPEQISDPYYEWFNTGNLYDTNDIRVDLTQVGGSFYSTIDDAKALIGGRNVLQVSVIVDGSELGDQVVYIDNVKINTYLYSSDPPEYVADFDSDHQVDSFDVGIMAQHWLRTDCLSDPNACDKTDLAPVIKDGKINFADFAEFALYWLLGVDEVPPAPATMSFASAPAATGPYSITMTAASASDDNGVEYYFNNETIPFHDSGWQPGPTFEDTGLYPEATYTYSVKIRDLSPRHNENENQYSASASATTDFDDTHVPILDPEGDYDPPVGAPRWEDPPSALSLSFAITMKAEEYVDVSGVQYKFYHYKEVQIGGVIVDYINDPNRDSEWQDSSSYTDTGLDPNTTYGYIYRVRDKSLNLNTTNPSFGAIVTTPLDTGQDVSPPVPDPMRWDQAPTPSSISSITMTASTAIDETGVEYFFDCTGGGGNDSEWQSSPTYEDIGLTTGVKYTYRVKARDTSPAQNQTGYSSSASVELSLATWDLQPNAIGSHTIVMAATPINVAGVQYYFENITIADQTHDSGWQSDVFYEDTALDPNTAYTYRVKAQYNSVIDFSEEASATTALAGAVQTLTLTSMPEYDGRVWGTDTSAIRYNGYDRTNKALRIGGRSLFGYAAVTSFDSTRLLPTKTAITISSATLELICGHHEEDDPFSWGGECKIDIDHAFSGVTALSASDWNHPGSGVDDARNIAQFTARPNVEDTMTSGDFSDIGKDLINRNGITQLRARFTQATNPTFEYIGFYSGEKSDKEPKLIIKYTD